MLNCLVPAFGTGTRQFYPLSHFIEILFTKQSYNPNLSDISNIFLIGRMAFSCTCSSTKISGSSYFKQL